MEKWVLDAFIGFFSYLKNSPDMLEQLFREKESRILPKAFVWKENSGSRSMS